VSTDSRKPVPDSGGPQKVSLIRIRRMHPELTEGYSAPLFSWLPILGIISNLSLANPDNVAPLLRLAIPMAKRRNS